MDDRDQNIRLRRNPKLEKLISVNWSKVHPYRKYSKRLVIKPGMKLLWVYLN